MSETLDKKKGKDIIDREHRLLCQYKSKLERKKENEISYHDQYIERVTKPNKGFSKFCRDLFSK